MTVVNINNIQIHILFLIINYLNFTLRGFDVVIKLLIIKPHGQVENIGLVETKGIQLITRRIILGVQLISKFTPLFLPC